MAILSLAGFDENALETGYATELTAMPTSRVEGRRPSSKAINYTSNSSADSAMTYSSLTTQSDVCVGFAFKRLPGSLTDRNSLYGLTFRGGGAGSSNPLLSISFEGNRLTTCQEAGLSGFTIIPVPAGVFLNTPIGEWNYYEFYVKPGLLGTGIFRFYRNENLVFEYNGTITGKTGTSSGADPVLAWDLISLESRGFHAIDDFYVTDGNVLGDVRIDTLLPTSDDNVEWSPGTDNYSLVNDEFILDPASYISADVEGALDVYNVQDVAAGRQVLAAQIQTYGKKTDAGTARIYPSIRTSAGPTLEPSYGLATSDNLVGHAIHEVDANGQPWTVEKINAAKIGIEATFT